MAITPDQRELRKRYAGSSDAAAIVGLDPFKTAYDIYLEKTGQADGFEGNENTERGELLEPVVLAWAEQRIERPFSRGFMKAADDGSMLAANFDGICHSWDNGKPFIVEAKTATSADEWGEPGTDEIPERVTVQVHHQFAVAGSAYCLAYVPVLLPVFGRFDFRLYRVERNDDLAEIIARRGAEFMAEHVAKRVPPENCLPSLEVLKRVRREPQKRQEVPREVYAAWLAERELKLNTEKREKAARAALITALLDAEAGTIDGVDVCTYFEQKCKGYVVEEYKSRVLRVKGAK